MNRPLRLPQHDEDPTGRRRALDRARRQYVFETDDPRASTGFRWVKGLPLPELRRPEMARLVPRFASVGQRVASIRAGDGVRLRLSRAAGRLRARMAKAATDPFAWHRSVYRGRPVPWIAVGDRWRSDVLYGHQRLAGMAPLYLEAVREIPEAFAVTDADVRKAPDWPEGATIDDMIAARRLWMVRHPELADIQPTRDDGATLCAPHTLFLVRDDEQLVPVAIQLFVDSDVVFTPADDLDDDGAPTHRWLVAKMFATNADTLVYTMFTHTTTMHLLLESAWGAACRTLSDRHPLKALLAPHTEGTQTIGHFFRPYYTRERGEVVRLHQAGFEGTWDLMGTLRAGWSFERLDIAAEFARRGTDEAGFPPRYHFRDDALAHWALLRRYAQEACTAIYPDAETLKGDVELAAWARALADREQGAGIPGLPVGEDGTFRTVDDVAAVLAGLVYQAAVMHSHAQNAAYAYYTFAPNTPAALRLAPPRDHVARYTLEAIADALPVVDDLVLQVALSYGNEPRDGERERFFTSLIAQFAPDFMAGAPPAIRDGVLAAAARWRAGLDALAASQDARNATLEPVPYTFLHPATMANSVQS